MVVGLEKFREHFAGHEDRYVIIGGTACDLLFTAAGRPFRATKDIDMVLCVEVFDGTFVASLTAFLDAGGYQVHERSDGKKAFYRFQKPTDKSFPYMIELLSRKQETLRLSDSAKFTQIPVNEDMISLSAILLDADYYDAMQSRKRIVDGVTIVDETLIIPLKARAFLDLSDRSDKGEKIHTNDIRKHRNDVFRLAQLLPRDAGIKLAEPILVDLRRFLDLASKDASLDPKSFKVPFSRDEVIALLRSAYELI